MIPEDISTEKLNEYILLDNANFGKWDFDALANEWEAELLADMNIDVPKISEVIGEDAYTKKINIPVYEPSERKPELKELCDTSKRDELVAQIDKTNIPSEVKRFLKLAAEQKRLHHVIAWNNAVPKFAKSTKNSTKVTI